MQIIPVLDVMYGQVVRGVGGRRDEYRPIVSKLVLSAEPLAVARAFRDRFDFDELYVADLDAIGGHEPALGLYARLQRDGFRLWVDAGLRAMGDAEILVRAGVTKIIAGLETLSGPDLLGMLYARFGECILFSLDLKGGRSLGDEGQWPSEPEAIADRAIRACANAILVLDLADVGEARGTRTVELCSRLTKKCPRVRIIAGGGIRDMDDVRRLEQAGVHTVLVASALHDGRITPPV